jgi:peptidoglycan/xylan/chitin deacetylase (PgdA/CDA1 family)
MVGARQRCPRDRSDGILMVWLLVSILFVGLAFAAWFYYACTVPTSRFFRPALVRGPAQGRKIALTFDDGPSSPFSEKILDILRDKKVPAAFFVCGKNVERYPHIVERMAQEGHTLGNHTFSHPFVYFRSSRFIGDEIDRTQASIERASGVRPTVFRPPYGARWLGLMGVLRARGLKLIMWSATGYDWKLQTEGVVSSTLRELKPGAVVLLHDGHNVAPPETIDRSNTVAALPAIIDLARAAGYEFVPLTEFLAA